MGTNITSSPVAVQTPYILVLIGSYKFGAYNKDEFGSRKYPNYIKSLEILKINGLVNTYKLLIDYGITEQDDPNYFEKVFASVSDSRDITFTYGDLSVKNYIYREEKAIITSVESSVSIENACISYTVNAVSKGSLTLSGTYPFIVPNKKIKPSTEILRILKDNSTYGLLDLFSGMRNMTKVSELGLIPFNDLAVNLESQSSASVLDRLQYLVSCMVPDTRPSTTSNTAEVRKLALKEKQLGSGIASKGFYIIEFLDDTTDELGGPYFKIKQVDSALSHPEAYELNIGYPNGNAVSDFRVENNENYSIFYNYQNLLHPETYVRRLNKYGEYEDFYAPVLSSNNNTFTTRENDRTWWAKETQYPVKASVTIKGLLRPALLMQYIRLKISFYGRRHIHSGLYIITKQVDVVNESGYKTTLNMLRVGADDEYGL